MLSIFYPGLEIKLKHTWPCSKFAYAYKKKACIYSQDFNFPSASKSCPTKFECLFEGLYR